MAKIKFVVDDPAGPLHDYYVKGDNGKYHLDLDDHPDTVKLAEFRTNNRTLNAAKTELEAKLEKFKDVNLEEYQTLKAKLTEQETSLAAEKKAHADSQLKNTLTFEFLRMGGRESAVDFMADRAMKVFEWKDGKPTHKNNEFSKNTPGEPLSISEWIEQQVPTTDFAFKPSRGGGATGNSGGGGGPRRIANDPVTVGRNLEAIARGDVVVED